MTDEPVEDEWIEIQENGKPLWKFHRGVWGYQGRKIADVKIGDDGISLWIKVGPVIRNEWRSDDDI